MRLLGIDTSSQVAGAAVVDGGEIICEYTLNRKKTHSAQLLPMIEDMLSAVELSLSDMDGFACGVGPGSFTGVRIGVATVKGFAQALSKPVIAVDSLETLAYSTAPQEGLIATALFARVDELFCAVYERQGGILKPVIDPAVLTIDELLKAVGAREVLFVGDGGELHRATIEKEMGERARFASVRQNMISAANLALLAEQRAARGEWKRYDEIEPLYLRVSQAEREYQEKQKGETR